MSVLTVAVVVIAVCAVIAVLIGLGYIASRIQGIDDLLETIGPVIGILVFAVVSVWLLNGGMTSLLGSF